MNRTFAQGGINDYRKYNGRDGRNHQGSYQGRHDCDVSARRNDCEDDRDSSKEVDDASSKGIDELRDEISKQTLRQGFELQQAKIAQELAIAHRITNAESVEIEEFYDTSMSGKAGLETKETGVMFGVGGERQSVTKRIY